MSKIIEELGNQEIYFNVKITSQSPANLKIERIPLYGSEIRQKEVDSYVQSELGRDNKECGAVGCRRWCQKGTDWCPSHQSKEL